MKHGGFINDKFKQYRTGSHASQNDLTIDQNGNPDGGVPLRANYASIGYTYDKQRDAFIPPQPFPSWLLDENTCLWNSPVPYPTDVGTAENPKIYKWDEPTISWIERNV